MAAPKISGLTATNIVVANMVGTGVFTSLGFQVASIHSDFALIALWIIGGVASLCGALSYAELAAALPRSGGEYHFLSRIYHPAVGFMSGWLSATVGFAAPIALAAIAFGSYLQGIMPGIPPIASALLVVWVTVAVHLYGVRAGEIFQNWTTILKLILIVIFIVAGLLFGVKQPFRLVPGPDDLGALLSSPFAVSMVFVMYSYTGWNAASYITEEVHDAHRNVPRALLAGTLIVSALYVLLNLVFLLATPRGQLTGQLQVGLIAGNAIFGVGGGRIVSVLISFGLIATVSGMAWIGSRVTKAVANDLPALGFFGRTNRRNAPVVAILLQAFIVTGLIMTASFEAITVYIEFSLLACSFLTVLGLFVLRWREPDLPRPYKVWLYPFVPALFLLILIYMMSYVLLERPLQSLLGLLTITAGIAIYYLAKRAGPRSIAQPAPESSV